MCGDEEEEDEKSADETERGYSRAAGGDGEMERFEEAREDRKCVECGSREVEDVEHF